jgi:DNA-directed RNA polymerase specialized sigma24 family protein
LSVESTAGPKHSGVGRGLESPFELFYRTNYAWAVNVAYLLIDDRWAAEDLVQESFSRIHGRFEDLDNPGAFLRVCVVNASRSWHRNRSRELRRLPALPPATSPLGAFELLDALNRLPYRQKAVLVLRYYADLSEAEIAHALDCRPGTVKSLAVRGLGRLRKEIEP